MNEQKAEVSVFMELFAMLSKIIFDGLDINDVKLSKMELLVLLILDGHPGISMSTIAKEMSTSKVQVSRLISSLEKNQAVKRQHNKENRRIVNVFLTPHGDTIIRQKKEQVQSHIAKKLIHFKEEDLDLFEIHLNALIKILARYEIIQH